MKPISSLTSIQNPNQLTMKFILTGPSAVGKSCLSTQFIENQFNSRHEVTVGVEFGTYVVTLSDGQEIKLQIWDTCGQESFKAITRSYYRGAHGILLVYDITNRSTFQYLGSWLEECQTNGDDGAVIVLIGNKCDSESMREVEVEEGKLFAQQNSLLFFETSAKTSENVEEAFIQAIYLIYEKYKNGQIKIEPTVKSKKGTIDNLSFKNYDFISNEEKSSGCCGST